MTIAKDYGFLPKNDGVQNAIALQKAVDLGGDIYIDTPGIYLVSDTIYIGDDTSIVFCAGSYMKRIANEEETGYVFINKGAYTQTYNKNIKIKNLHLLCNNVVSGQPTLQSRKAIPGISAHVAFYYIKNLEITGFETLDLPSKDFAIQVCTFENLLIENVKIEGLKDGIHLGRGSKFIIRNCIFKTFDDPIALNAHDYTTSNPQLGWIEDGLIENCYDLDAPETTGFFCRILAGSWRDWEKGMQVQRSDSVVYHGRVYRVLMPVDGKIYSSHTPPTHESGLKEYDGIIWCMVQNDETYNCGCRNIHFRNIFLQKKRPVAFSVHFDKDNYSRSYYPNSNAPLQENIIFENICLKNDIPILLMSVTPVTGLKFINSVIDGSKIHLKNINTPGIYYPKTTILFSGTTFKGNIDTLIQCDPDVNASLKIYGSIADDNFETKVVGEVEIKDSDINLNRER